ncbi:MAG: hypothetical protein ACD_65C00125G0006 [uncultured bacterium]|nr:MAG: hypothetical protein ACD_65C00125G0006 [uncultured bacterium]
MIKKKYKVIYSNVPAAKFVCIHVPAEITHADSPFAIN